ncbi:MAG TPA: hypothetical protein VI790_01405, partial [Candidatus Nanoarchaeia archaeon]|nr:hypothetical protein [Candidatus Nanoarchaeia archaeon]
MYLKQKIATFMLNRILGIKSDFSNLKEVEKYQVKKLKKKLKIAYTTPYWHETLDTICNETNINFEELINNINSISDFQKIVPETTRQVLSDNGSKMTTKPLSELVEMHTSGTSTNKPVSVYSTSLDMASMSLAMNNICVKGGLTQFSHIIALFPRESSIWNSDGKVQRVIPNMEFVDLNKVDNEGIIKLLQADGIYSYTNVYIGLFNKFRDVINDYKNKGGEIKLKALFGGGDFLAKGAIDEIRNILGTNITEFNPLISIEAPGVSYMCKKENIHLPNEFYFTEIKPLSEDYYKTRIENLSSLAKFYELTELEDLLKEGSNLSNISKQLKEYLIKNNNELAYETETLTELIDKGLNNRIGELLITNINSKGMHYFRYHTGDVAELVDCDCGALDKSIKMVGRVQLTEVHKSIRVETVMNIVYTSNSFKTGKISSQPGHIKTYMDGRTRVIDVYLKKGDSLTAKEDELVI